MKRPLLLLFDGHALVHRAFHALPPLSTSKTGEPTGAVYGFTRMLLKVLQDFKPTHWAISFDRPAPTFRHLEFEEYKAQRPEAPDDLRRQFGRVRQIVEALDMPSFELDGYEADDLLGTLSRQAAAQGIDTIIVSGDNDMLQLVTASVSVLLPQRTFGDTTLYDPAAVQQKYGISPGQIPDFKGLKGDPSDNIPGVSGVGDKTAASLVQLYGSVEGIYGHIDEVTPAKLRDTLATQEELARQGKRLATIMTDAPVDLDPSRCQLKRLNRDRLAPLFRELEFFTLVDRLPDIGEPPQAEPAATAIDRRQYVVINTLAALEALAARLARASSFVIHPSVRSGVSGTAAVSGLALSIEGDTCYIPLAQGLLDMSPQVDPQRTLELLRPVLSDSRTAKVAHDGKQVMKRLADFSVELVNLQFDTLVAAYLLGEKSLDLKDLAPGKLGQEIAPPTGAPAAVDDRTTEAGVSAAAEHACDEAVAILNLRPVLQAELQDKGLLRLYNEVEIPLIPVLARMERHGVKLDTELLKRMSQELGARLLDLERKIYQHAGHSFNINSPQQLGSVLFGELRLPGAKRTKTGFSTNASVLEELKGAHPIVNPILDYRQLVKLKSTYIDALPALIDPATGRVHTTFNQTATATGRLSSSDPNLQNIPIRGELGKEVRKAFVAQPPCMLLSADYSQIELRILAHLSQDPGLMAAFRQDEDIHAATASQVLGVALSQVTPDMRRLAKVVNFGIVYGMSDYGLQQATELSRQEAAQFIASYFQRYPRVKGYLDATRQQARDRGYVQTLLGRRRYIPEIHSPNRQVREAAERMAINMPVQGTAADVIKIAMINLQREMDSRGMKSMMILQVHDELLFEVTPDELDVMKALTADTMSGAVELSVPLKVEVKAGRNWGEME